MTLNLILILKPGGGTEGFRVDLNSLTEQEDGAQQVRGRNRILHEPGERVRPPKGRVMGGIGEGGDHAPAR